jgi:hypothetical protein
MLKCHFPSALNCEQHDRSHAHLPHLCRSHIVQQRYRDGITTDTREQMVSQRNPTASLTFCILCAD